MEGELEGRAAKRLKVDASPIQNSHEANGAPDGSKNTDLMTGGQVQIGNTQLGDVTNSSASNAGQVNPAGNGNAGAENIAPPKPADSKGPVRNPQSKGKQTQERGLAPVKAEYVLARTEQGKSVEAATINDDAAEGRGPEEGQKAGPKNKQERKKERGQNQNRSFGTIEDAARLCNSRAYTSEFSPRHCNFGDRCKLLHDLRKYLEDGRREDLKTLDGICPSFEAHGQCPSGWKCRFVGSHMEEKEHEDGRKELVILGTEPEKSGKDSAEPNAQEGHLDVVNVVSTAIKMELNRKRVKMEEADKYIQWINAEAKLTEEIHNRRKRQVITDNADLWAQFNEPPFKPSEKRGLYFGRETPVLAPLTTQGNLPFRRICVELGAQMTYSEMALSLPLLQGNKNDWTLMKAHKSEITPPKVDPSLSGLVKIYDHARDIKFGAQISASQHWVAIKATESLKRFVPHLRVIDLNCGCPVDSIYKTGSGSALLDSQGRLERIVRGMNAVSGEIPISAKLRTGVRSNRPTATTIISKLAFGSRETREHIGAPGCAAVTLHGRSREQRYTKKADWSYIAECASMVKIYNEQKDKLADTAGEPDPSTLPNAKDGKMFFLGNGDCYSHVDYFDHIDKAGVDTVMIGRGALVKPWLFEEIEKGQYLDKSASERLGYVEKFVRFGLETWGSDEVGIGFTRRFLLEWLSFAHRYVPIGILEYLPPNLNDRPPIYRGRNELETLLASNNYRDWIKISEMFLGPCQPGFTFQPKHKSMAYEAEG